MLKNRITFKSLNRSLVHRWGVHVIFWLAIMTYNILTSLTTESAVKTHIIEIFWIHFSVYVPSFYLTYFLVLRAYEKHKNIFLLLFFQAVTFFVYILLIHTYVSQIRKWTNPALYSGKLKLNWNFVINVIDYYFLYYFLYALLYWYAQRNIRSQKALREKEAQEFKSQQQLQELESMALRAQMNPHFIFNSLNSVQYFIVDKDMATANRYLGRFGQLIRQTLDNSSESRISLERETEYLRTYLELEQMRAHTPFSFSINIDKELDPGTLFVPTMLLQPFVENAVKHGMMNKTGGEGLILVDIRFLNQNMVCTITDNGPGRAATQALKTGEQTGHQSKGMKITTDRIELLNKNQGAGIQFRITDPVNSNNQPEGTCIELAFPITFVINKPTH